ncbi:MAG: hypothetical protein DWQ05_12275 [Calditrichaeota bacterium]|nr:MAG: hypothetical protein DWQ05_12275 [Calditrichota bacterium]
MNNGGFIIRLIDITLIILFGFISISDLKVQALIKLPSVVEGDAAKQKITPLVVKIANNESFEFIENRKSKKAESLKELEVYFEAYLAKNPGQKNKTLVFIQPDIESSVQTTVAVIDICRKFELIRNLAFDYAAL